jgi:hypothetical protein
MEPEIEMESWWEDFYEAWNWGFLREVVVKE